MFLFSRINLIYATLLLLSIFFGNSPTKAEAAEPLPKYRVIDLGTLETDQSQAIAVNENGQVLGWIEDKGTKSAFLWDEKAGLKTIEFHGDRENLFLNNKGQVAGCRDDSWGGKQAFIWDQNKGFIDVWCLRNDGEIKGINDDGQVIGQAYVQDDVYSHAFLWDHGKAVDLTKELKQQIPSNWRWVRAIAINNNADVAITADLQVETSYGYTHVQKSFIWKNGVFSAIFPEKSLDAAVQIRAIDDFGNVVVFVQDDPISRYWFFNPFTGFKAYLLDGVNCIRNQQPVRTNALPSKLKRDFAGKPYYGYGVEIRKLLIIKEPFYNYEIDLSDQNSKGWVVGSMDTLYGGRHAFLAIPEKSAQDNP